MTIAEQMETALAAARKRLPVDGRASSMDGRHGIVKSVYLRRTEVVACLVVDGSGEVIEAAGYWSRAIA